MIKEWTLRHPLIETGETAYDFAALESLDEFKQVAADATVIFAIMRTAKGETSSTEQNCVARLLPR